MVRNAERAVARECSVPSWERYSSAGSGMRDVECHELERPGPLTTVKYDLVGASNLTDAKFCNTTMPDGTVRNDNC
jgi:hypothetical protein